MNSTHPAFTGTALITGASAGLGAEYARQIAARGMNLVISARRAERLDALAAELRATHGVQVEVIPADLADFPGIDLLVQRILRGGDISLLVNNAGFGLRGSFAEEKSGKWQSMVDVHITASVHLTHASLAPMLARGGGGIINVSSTAAFIEHSGSAMYSATKAFLNNFSSNLAAEMAGEGIAIQALCPGFTVTEFHSTAELDGWDRTSVPGWLWMQASEVVSESLRRLPRGPVILVPGLIYKLIALALRSPAGRIISALRTRMRSE